MRESEALYCFVLRMADSNLIMGQRLSELCSKGPYLEEDIAISNIALDYLGQANSFYDYASEKNTEKKSKDELIFRRDERSFFNYLLLEQENGNFADTIIKIFLYAAFQKCMYIELKKSKNQQLSAIAEKSLKEVTYHLRHSVNWVIRLGDGTEESKEKIQKALDSIWRFTGELFEMDEVDNILFEKQISCEFSSLKRDWDKIINDTLKEAKITRPKDSFMMSGGKKGLHSENLGFILAEMQYLQRSYPNAKW